MLAEKVEHGRIILVFGTGKKTALHGRVGAFLSEVSSYPLFQDLASGWIDDGTLVLVHDPADGWGTWRGWGAERRTAWTYTAAIGAAMTYAEHAWAVPPARLIPPREGSSAGRDRNGAVSIDREPTGGGPARLPLTETVESALHAAAASANRRGQPVGTKTLLTALMDADSAGRWDRILLYSRSREATEQVGYEDAKQLECECYDVRDDPSLRGRAQDRMPDLTAVRANPARAGRPSSRLIADRSNAAARALNIDDQDKQTFLARLVQDDLIGTSLVGLQLGSSTEAAKR